MRNRYATKGGFSAVVIKLRLPDGRIYEEDGKADYASKLLSRMRQSFGGHAVKREKS